MKENPTEWRCCICGKPADYKQSKIEYCAEHWNYGDPIKPTLDNCLEARTPSWYRKVRKNAH